MGIFHSFVENPTMKVSFFWNIFFICMCLSDNVQETISVLTNFGEGRPVFGVESWIEHYVELSEDPKGEGCPDTSESLNLFKAISRLSSQSATRF